MSMRDGYEQSGVAMTCRGFAEYGKMFGLTMDHLLDGEVLDVAAGASSFIAESGEHGLQAIAIDPRYGQKPDLLTVEAAEEIASSTAKLAGLADRYDWSYYGDLERHRAGRAASLAKFAADYRKPDSRERYLAGALPELPVKSGRFATVICSHFLFLYGEQFDAAFHEAAVRELMRVCRPGGRVLIYPLVTLQFQLYPELDQLLAAVKQAGGRYSLEETGLPFIPGSTHLLRIIT
ncbi:class I SAM-dependent methyltransferase [Paenibacillaceae bacterium]|nr:class I SAM-dependent methyltransferase [Paenibacillaceae bacterium]